MNNLALISEGWQPMPPQMGPPLPMSMEIYWPWYAVAAPPEVAPAPPLLPPIIPPAPPGVTTYSLSCYEVGQGTVAPGSGEYPAGSVITLAATPNYGYRFDYWSGNVSGTSPRVTIVMDSDKMAIGHFSEISEVPPTPPEEEPPIVPPEEEVPPVAPPAPADIRVENLFVQPGEVYINESVNVSVTATNYGGTGGSKVILCNVNGMASSEGVELAPNESRQVTFQVTPHEARTYSVSVNGLSGSFVAKGRVTQLLISLQSSLAELGHNLRTWGPGEEMFYVPGYGTSDMSWNTYDMIKARMVAEAIAAGLISSDADVYFENDHMYHTDGTRIV